MVLSRWQSWLMVRLWRTGGAVVSRRVQAGSGRSGSVRRFRPAVTPLEDRVVPSSNPWADTRTLPVARPAHHAAHGRIYTISVARPGHHAAHGRTGLGQGLVVNPDANVANPDGSSGMLSPNGGPGLPALPGLPGGSPGNPTGNPPPAEGPGLPPGFDIGG
jgi:hypothetical protein